MREEEYNFSITFKPILVSIDIGLTEIAIQLEAIRKLLEEGKVCVSVCAAPTLTHTANMKKAKKGA